MISDYKLTGEVVYLTGAAGQLGKQISKELILQGAKVIMVDKSMELLSSAIRGMNYKSDDYLLVEADITNENNVRQSMQDALSYFGKVSMQVNNAGASVFTPWFERSSAEISLTMDVNLKGTLFCIREFLELAKASATKTVIVNVASHYGFISPDPRIYTDLNRRNSEIYGATKAGIIQFTKYFAANANIDGYHTRINAIAPGGIYNQENPQGINFIKEYSARVPMGRMANTEEIVKPILFLLSPDASYINGTTLLVDGGMSCW